MPSRHSLLFHLLLPADPMGMLQREQAVIMVPALRHIKWCRRRRPRHILLLRVDSRIIHPIDLNRIMPRPAFLLSFLIGVALF